MDGEILLVRCMDRRGGERADAIKEKEAKSGKKADELSLAVPDVEKLFPDIDQKMERGNVVAIYLMTHGSKTPEVIKGCGGIVVGQKVARGELRPSERVVDFETRIEQKGVDLKNLSSNEAEEATAQAMLKALKDHLKSKGYNVPVYLRPMEFGLEDEPHGASLTVLFRFPTNRTMQSDIESLQKQGMQIERRDTYLLSCGDPERALASLEMATTVIGARQVVLVATNERERDRLAEFQDKLSGKAFRRIMEGTTLSLRMVQANATTSGSSLQKKSRAF